MNGSQYAGIIFDFNGVLLWDSDWHELSWQKLAQNLGVTDTRLQGLAAWMPGRTNADILAHLLGRPAAPQELAAAIEAKESLYRELCLLNPRRFTVSPGAENLLDWLALHDIPRTIATSSELTNLDFFIRHLRLDRWFDIKSLVYDDGVRPGKPAPDIYAEASRLIDVDPSRCVVVEDAPAGLAAAHGAGIGYIVALGPVERHAALTALPGVSAVIRSLRTFPRDKLATAGP